MADFEAATRLRRGVLGRGDIWVLNRRVARMSLASAADTELYQGRHTRIWQLAAWPEYALKLSFLKSAPRDVWRRYGASQARREIQATAIMQQLSFATPELLGHGLPLNPARRWDSLLVMRLLPAHETLRVFLRRCRESMIRQTVLDAVASGVARIYAAGFHHKDCHLENVVRCRDGQLIWIDNDLRYTRKPQLQARRLTATLDQLLDTSPDFVSRAEWHHFAAVLAQQLQPHAWLQQMLEPVLQHFRQRVAALDIHET